ncbi:hypothetical protein NPIL_643201 [Nephila pilipes]|uniref:Uncharacterized protein n=1 Tax=Nephila pilipes TaxID=299642 RepID=A0A8X6N8G0_NEPPI|nr:hypothetical protein NPIL_643201 [Nephila pilipes]
MYEDPPLRDDPMTEMNPRESLVGFCFATIQWRFAEAQVDRKTPFDTRMFVTNNQDFCIPLNATKANTGKVKKYSMLDPTPTEVRLLFSNEHFWPASRS